jgi:hypothetical protein
MLIKMTEMALATALVVGAASAALAWKDGDHKSGGYHPGVPPPAPAVVPTAAPVAALAAAPAKRRKITMAFAPGDITGPIAEAAAGRAGALVAQWTITHIDMNVRSLQKNSKSYLSW